MPDLNFRTSLYESNAIELPLLPTGDYIAKITDIKLIKTKMATLNNTDDCYLNLKFKIEEGEYKGRLIWANINIINSRKESQDIGRGTLKSIAVLLNVLDELDNSRDTDWLINRNIGIKIDKKNNEYKNKQENYISCYKDSSKVQVDTNLKLEDKFSSLQFDESCNVQDNEFVDDIPF